MSFWPRKSGQLQHPRAHPDRRAVLHPDGLFTVGFGDITATSQSARVFVMVQMVLDLVILGLGVRVYRGAVSVGRKRSDARGGGQLLAAAVAMVTAVALDGRGRRAVPSPGENEPKASHTIAGGVQRGLRDLGPYVRRRLRCLPESGTAARPARRDGRTGWEVRDDDPNDDAAGLVPRPKPPTRISLLGRHALVTSGVGQRSRDDGPGAAACDGFRRCSHGCPTGGL